MNAANGADGAGPLLTLTDVVKHFPVRQSLVQRGGAVVHAVDGVSLSVAEGETLGIVGETGCGKSTLARCASRLYPLTSGRIEFDGQDITGLSRRQLRAVRRNVQMVFQDPFSSLNPRRRVGSIIADPLVIHGAVPRSELRARVQELMELVGLNPEHYNRFPADFSGGQRQRIGIARALGLQPKLLICDEPVSALDVSIQAQIINLLADLQAELGLTYVFIAHDLSVVEHVSDRVAVMYLGKIVEVAEAGRLYAAPRHPYTAALLSAAWIPDPDQAAAREQIVLSGEVPSPVDPPAGCRFHTRCPWAQELCAAEEPPLLPAPDAASHLTACHFPLAAGQPAPPPASASPGGRPPQTPPQNARDRSVP
jgi:oligopeptide/dipeptide ABC transporter ATP-binding protein